jgi:hypothetical protein
MSRTMLMLHRWVGLVVGVMIMIAAGTAIALNHQDLFMRPASGDKATSPYGRYMLSMVADPAHPERLLAGTSDGLFRSADGGKTWEDVVMSVPAEQVVALRADERHPGVVYAAMRKIGVFRSDDMGDVWEEVPMPFNPAAGATIQALDVTPAGLTVLTTDGVWAQSGTRWAHAAPPARQAEADARGPLQLVYNLHDGRAWGQWGVPLTDAVSVSLLGLVLSGYVVFAARLVKTRRARKRAARAAVAKPASAGGLA